MTVFRLMAFSQMRMLLSRGSSGVGGVPKGPRRASGNSGDLWAGHEEEPLAAGRVRGFSISGNFQGDLAGC